MRLDKKPEQIDFRDSELSAGGLNEIIKAMPRQLVGGEGVNVEQLGDRFRITRSGAPGLFLPDVTNYLARFVVLHERDDYLVCASFLQPVNPATGVWKPQEHDAELGSATANHGYWFVAKPRPLQRTPWDGKTVLEGGNSITYAYTDEHTRTATTADGVLTESINRPYFPGDIIIAVHGVTGVNANEFGDGSSSVNPVVAWEDMNFAGRVYGNNTSGLLYAKVTAIAGENCETGTGTPDYLVLPCGWAYAELIHSEDDGCSWTAGAQIYLAPVGGTTFRVGQPYLCIFVENVPEEICPGVPTTGTATFPLYFAIGDYCTGLYTGTRTVLVNVAVACVSGVIGVTKTFEYWHFSCGKLTGITS